jgi:hypothetical protein
MIMKNVWGLVVLVMIVVASPASTFARLGETEAECLNRYGKSATTFAPLLDGAINHQYNYQGWRIRVAFINGKAARLSYHKTGESGGSLYIQPDEAQAILAGEVGGGQWKEKTNLTINPIAAMNKPKTWKNTNGNIAYLEAMKTALVVETPEVEAFIKAQREEKEQQRKASTPKF